MKKNDVFQLMISIHFSNFPSLSLSGKTSAANLCLRLFTHCHSCIIHACILILIWVKISILPIQSNQSKFVVNRHPKSVRFRMSSILPGTAKEGDQLVICTVEQMCFQPLMKRASGGSGSDFEWQVVPGSGGSNAEGPS